jgi:hypothetical protein
MMMSIDGSPAELLPSLRSYSPLGGAITYTFTNQHICQWLGMTLDNHKLKEEILMTVINAQDNHVYSAIGHGRMVPFSHS